MRIIFKGIKLFFIGIYIDILKSIISKNVKKRLEKRKIISSPFLIFLSQKCNFASELFLEIEKEFTFL